MFFDSLGIYTTDLGETNASMYYIGFTGTHSVKSRFVLYIDEYLRLSICLPECHVADHRQACAILQLPIYTQHSSYPIYSSIALTHPLPKVFIRHTYRRLEPQAGLCHHIL